MTSFRIGTSPGLTITGKTVVLYPGKFKLITYWPGLILKTIFGVTKPEALPSITIEAPAGSLVTNYDPDSEPSLTAPFDLELPVVIVFVSKTTAIS